MSKVLKYYNNVKKIFWISFACGLGVAPSLMNVFHHEHIYGMWFILIAALIIGYQTKDM